MKQKNVFGVLFLTFVWLSQINGQVSEKFYFKSKGSKSIIYERNENESVSQFIIYSDSTFEFYYGNIGFVHKYTFGKIKYESSEIFYANSALEEFKSKPDLTVHKSQRCKTFRFINFERVKIVDKEKFLEVFRDPSQDLNSRTGGIPMDSIIPCPPIKEGSISN